MLERTSYKKVEKSEFKNARYSWYVNVLDAFEDNY